MEEMAKDSLMNTYPNYISRFQSTRSIKERYTEMNSYPSLHCLFIKERQFAC